VWPKRFQFYPRSTNVVH